MRRQFLLEAALLSGAGGLLGMGIAGSIGFVLSIAAPGIPAIPPLWAVASGLASALVVGIGAGYWPARTAASLDPVDALRYEQAALMSRLPDRGPQSPLKLYARTARFEAARRRKATAPETRWTDIAPTLAQINTNSHGGPADREQDPR